MLDVYPLIVCSYSDELFGPLPQLTAEDVEPDWSSFLAGLNLNKANNHRLQAGGFENTVE